MVRVCLSLVGMKIDLVFVQKCCRDSSFIMKKPLRSKPPSNLTIINVATSLPKKCPEKKKMFALILEALSHIRRKAEFKEE